MNKPSGLNPENPLGDQFQPVLSAAQAGAEWAIELLYKHVNPRLLRYLTVHEPSESEDLASEVWLDVASALARFEGDEADLRAWVFTIARRRVFDLRRRRSRRRTDLVPAGDLSWIPGGENPESVALTAEATARAIEIINSLPPAQAEVILLRVVGGLDLAQTADILRKSPGAVRVLQHRALKALAKRTKQRV